MQFTRRKNKKKNGKKNVPAKPTLTFREARFVEEYLRDGDGPRAALRAGFSRFKIHQRAEGLLKREKIVQAIRERRAELEFASKVVRERVTAELARIAFFNAKYLFDENGNPIPLNELPDDMTAAIEAVEVQTLPDGTVTSRAKFYNKLKALDILGKIIGTHGVVQDEEENERDRDEVYAMLKNLSRDELRALKEAYYRIKGVAVLEDKRKEGVKK